MYCKQCGTSLEEGLEKCPRCLTKVGKGQRYCPICGTAKKNNSSTCAECGYDFLTKANHQVPPAAVQMTLPEQNTQEQKNPGITEMPKASSPPETPENESGSAKETGLVEEKPVQQPAPANLTYAIPMIQEKISIPASAHEAQETPEVQETRLNIETQELQETHKAQKIVPVPPETSEALEPPEASEKPVAQVAPEIPVAPVAQEAPEASDSAKPHDVVIPVQDVSPIFVKILRNDAIQRDTKTAIIKDSQQEVPAATDYLDQFNQQTQDRKNKQKMAQELQRAEMERKRELEAKRNGTWNKGKKEFQDQPVKDKAQIDAEKKAKRDAEIAAKNQKKSADAAAKKAAKEAKIAARIKQKQDRLAAKAKRYQINDFSAEPPKQTPEKTDSPKKEMPAAKKHKPADAAAVMGFVLTVCSIGNIFNVTRDQTILTVAGFCTCVGLISSLIGVKSEFSFLARAGIALSMISAICLAAPFILARTGL